jgi:hypothetical protein
LGETRTVVVLEENRILFRTRTPCYAHGPRVACDPFTTVCAPNIIWLFKLVVWFTRGFLAGDFFTEVRGVQAILLIQAIQTVHIELIKEIRVAYIVFYFL